MYHIKSIIRNLPLMHLFLHIWMSEVPFVYIMKCVSQWNVKHLLFKTFSSVIYLSDACVCTTCNMCKYPLMSSYWPQKQLTCLQVSCRWIKILANVQKIHHTALYWGLLSALHYSEINNLFYRKKAELFFSKYIFFYV